jgi:hypothetical protein
VREIVIAAATKECRQPKNRHSASLVPLLRYDYSSLLFNDIICFFKNKLCIHKFYACRINGLKESFEVKLQQVSSCESQ